MIPTLTNPSALLLLLFLPLLYWWCRKSLSGLGQTRQTLALVIRGVLMTLLVLALARFHIKRTSDDLCVYFVLDQSKSIPIDLKSKAFDYLNYAAAKTDPEKEESAALIVFGSNAGIETSPSPRLKVDDIHTVLNPSATDVSGALRLAMAAFPEGVLKRIVLVTDGNENHGHALAEAQNAKANGIVIDVLPLEYARGAEVLVEKVILPSQVLPDEEFEVKIIVKAFQAGRATLRLFENNKLIASQPVEVYPDRPNVFTVIRTLEAPDFYTFEAVIEPESDTIPENNRGFGFVDVKGDPRILFVTEDVERDHYLPDALKEEGLHVEVGGLSEIPVAPAEMQRWDLLILSNVPASAMTGGKNSQMSMIRDAVHNSGIGLVMVGGDNAFGAGGYKGTEIEEALPVDMDVTQKKILPSGALVLVMDAVEFANGNAWAREICKAAIDGISTRDQIGIYTTEWFLPLQQAQNKAAIRSKVNRIQPSDCAPGPGVAAASQVLQNATAGIKHVVVISDSGFGGWGGDNGNLGPFKVLEDMRKNKITTSAVVIGPHVPQQAQNMENIARVGGGNFYYPKSPESLPQIFLKEAAVVKKSLIWEQEAFVPTLKYSTVPLSGITQDALPNLHGYVITTAKNSPLVNVPLVSKDGEDGDPILAHWRYGLGKSIAFTSDSKNKWGADWVEWSEFSKLWAQAVRWSMRPNAGWDYTVTTRIDGSEGKIVVDAVNEAGEFENFLNLSGGITSPDIKNQEVKLSQVGPGRYEGVFKADQVGTYIVNLKEDTKKDAVPFRTGVAVSYSPEYRQFETNFGLLKQIVETTGGRMLTPDDNVFERNMPNIEVSKPLWPTLLLIALCLFPFDVFVRRVMIDYDRLTLALKRFFSFIPVLGSKWKGLPDRSPTPTGGIVRPTATPAGPRPHIQPGAFANLDSDSATAPPASSAKRSPTAAPAQPPDPETYTQRLLAAKKRAMKKK
ncbi:MAG: VWA domain-containing protein [Planctomycetota bacterium]|nr:VWA domain-containing protein [Planctomycetota bacterium]